MSSHRYRSSGSRAGNPLCLISIRWVLYGQWFFPVFSVISSRLVSFIPTWNSADLVVPIYLYENKGVAVFMTSIRRWRIWIIRELYESWKWEGPVFLNIWRWESQWENTKRPDDRQSRCRESFSRLRLARRDILRSDSGLSIYYFAVSFVARADGDNGMKPFISILLFLLKASVNLKCTMPISLPLFKSPGIYLAFGANTWLALCSTKHINAYLTWTTRHLPAWMKKWRREILSYARGYPWWLSIAIVIALWNVLVESI